VAADQDPVILSQAGVPLALCGETAQAQRLSDDAHKRYPLDTLQNAVGIPSVRAAIELARNQPDKVVELLRTAAPYERAYAVPVYLRGLAYLRAKQGAPAAAEFEKALSRRGAYWWNALLYSLSHVGLARAAVLSGDTAKARKSYQDFLALWKDADADLPVLAEARKELAALPTSP
jgi:ATP/maltotriose-dependent transcriptional regulator MalT